MRSLTSMFLIVMLICTVSAFANTVPSNDPSMVGGTPAQPTNSELDEGNVCLIQDIASFWGNSNEDILMSMAPDVTYTIINSSTLTPTYDFSMYDLVIVEGNQPATFNQNVLDNMDALQNYVQFDGGWLQFHMATNTHVPQMMLWNGTTYVNAENDVENYMGPDGLGHPALAGVAEPYEGNATNHGYLVGYPPGANEIVVNSDPTHPTYIDFAWGGSGGKVVVTTMTMEFLWNNGYNSGQILWNTIDWMANHAPPGPVSFNLYPVVTNIPPAGGMVVYDGELISTIPLSLPIRYRTYYTPPGGTSMGPIIDFPFTLVPFMNIYVAGMTMFIPDYYPAGNYLFEAMVGVPANPAYQLWDDFVFTKHPPVAPNLHEDFEDGLAQGFVWETTPGSYLIDAGYCKLDATPNTTTWASGTYNDVDFGDLTAVSTFEIQNASTSSRGILWRTNGPRDADFEGYGMYVSSTSYSMWRYAAGTATNVVPWTTSLDINTGVGAVNTLSVEVVGSNHDMFINGNYQGSATDATYTSGYSGMIAAYGTLTWYEDIHCVHVVGAAPDGAARMGEPLVGNFDDMGNPVGYEIITDGPGLFDRSEEMRAERQLRLEDVISTGYQVFGEAGSKVSVPSKFTLENAYPNPFNAATTVRVTLPEAADLTVSVYNVAGQLVATIADGNYSAGKHSLTFDASNVASGLYFIRATVPGQLDATQKVMLVR
jgi:Secretion system C-terminal sorting domain